MRIAGIQSCNRVQNNNLDCKKKQNPNFGMLKIDGKLSLDLSLPACKKGLGQLYSNHFEALRRSGAEGSEIIYNRLVNGNVDLSFRNPNISRVYGLPVITTTPENLLHEWLKIKPEDVAMLEERLRNIVKGVRQSLLEKSLFDDKMYNKIISLSPNKEKTIIKAIDSLPEEVAVGLRFKDDRVVDLNHNIVNVDISGL